MFDEVVLHECFACAFRGSYSVVDPLVNLQVLRIHFTRWKTFKMLMVYGYLGFVKLWQYLTLFLLLSVVAAMG